MNENIPLDINNNSDIPAEINYPRMNLIQRIISVILAPGKVMQSLEQKPRILFALLLTILTPVVMIFSVLPMYKESLMSTRDAIEATYERMNIQMTAEQIDNILNKTATSAPFLLAFYAVALWFLGALVLWGIIKVFKGEGRYKQILSITGYSAVISALAVIVKIIFTQFTGIYSDISVTSLASLLPNMKGNFLYGAAKAIDVFSIWQYVVIAIGTATVSKLDKKKVYIIVACIFAVLAIYAGVTEVSSAAMINKT
ncbi:MAG: Yip1 family protein [Ruminiclostridium sp.]